MRKLSLDYIIEQRPDITILSKEYKGIKSPLEYICTCGEIHTATAEKLLNGQLCKKCGNKKQWESRKVSTDILQDKFPSLNIISFDSPFVTLICNQCGKAFTKRYYHLSEDSICQDCSSSNRRFKYTQESFANLFSDIKILSPYTGVKNLVKCRCLVCNEEWETTADNLLQGRRGCKCSSKSNMELEVKDFVSSVYSGSIFYNKRDTISPYELDIFISDKKVAIEFNGNYWHSNIHKDKYYHLNKYKMCDKLGIRLIQIWEYEWSNLRKREILKSIIKSALGISERKLDARKCELRILSSKEVQDFIDENNLAGKRNGFKAFCLFYKDELVQCMLLGKSTFYKNGYKDTGKAPYEIIRAATKRDAQVRGGTSKLLKHIEDFVGSEPLIYFVELDHFNGSGLRNRNDWVLEKEQPTTKVWWKQGNVVKSRNSYEYHYFKEQEALGKASIIYTTGTAKYVYCKNSLE